MTRLDLVAVRSSVSRSLPNSLTEFSPLTPEAASSTLSSMYWEKLNSTPGNCALQRLGHLRRQLLLVDAVRPVIERLQRHEELGIEEAGRVGAVIGPAMLRDDRLTSGKRR